MMRASQKFSFGILQPSWVHKVTLVGEWGCFSGYLCLSPCRVEVWAEEGQSLGLSIVGGRHVIKRLRNGEELKGIFIKQVLPNSPADKTQCLKTGDKILEVGLGLLPGSLHNIQLQQVV